LHAEILRSLNDLSHENNISCKFLERRAAKLPMFFSHFCRSHMSLICVCFYLIKTAVDEYLNPNDQTTVCSAALQTTAELHITAPVVLDVCHVTEMGEWGIIGCVVDRTSPWGYELSFTNFSGIGCTLPDQVFTLNAPGCFAFDNSPYIVDAVCRGIPTPAPTVSPSRPSESPTESPTYRPTVTDNGYFIQINFMVCLMHLIAAFYFI